MLSDFKYILSAVILHSSGVVRLDVKITLHDFCSSIAVRRFLKKWDYI